MRPSNAGASTRRTGWWGVLTLIAALLAATAPVHAGQVVMRDDGTTVIRVVVSPEMGLLPDPTRTDTFSRAETAVVNEFVRRFPTIFAQRYGDEYKADPDRYGRHDWDKVAVELVPFSTIAVTGLETDLLAIAGGVAPDVLYVQFRKSNNYIENGFLHPLDKPEDGYLTTMLPEEVDFRVNPKIWPVIRRKGPDGETRVWAMPFGGVLGTVLLYRKDLFDRYGVAYPTADWTWTDLMAASRKLTNPQDSTYGMLLGTGKYESWFWNNYLWAAGGDVMSYDAATDQWRCVFDSREAAVALDFYLRLTTEKWTDAQGRIHRGYADLTNLTNNWDQGRVAMRMEYIDGKLFSTINPDVTGMAPTPKGPTGIRAGELNSRMMGLFSQITHPAVRDAAWEFIRWHDCEDAERLRTRVMVEGGMGRFINPTYLKLFGYPEVERLAPKGWSEIFRIAIESGRPEPYGKNSNFAYQLVTIPIQEARAQMLAGNLPEDEEARLDALQEILRRGNARANEEMIGVISPQERRKRNWTAGVVLVAIVITFILVLRRVFRDFSPAKISVGGVSRRKGLQLHAYGWAYLLLVPALATILLWQYVPLVRGSIMAFQDYRILGQSSWVGVQNFGDLLYDNLWWQAVWNSVRYSFLIMALTFLPPIVLAILLDEVPRASVLFRVLYYLPAVIAGLVVTLLWKQFYEPNAMGVLNSVVMRIPAVAFVGMGLLLLLLACIFAMRLWGHGSRIPAVVFVIAGLVVLFTLLQLALPILVRSGEGWIDTLVYLPGRMLATREEAFRWLTDPDTALFACVLPMVWAGIGPGCLIYLAALRGIPPDYYEAADIDGANFVDKILFVVFPMLKPLILINFIGVFNGAWFGATSNVLAMTGGGANTEVAGLHIFYKAFMFLKFGPATAMAWMLAFMLIGFTVNQLRILSRLEFRTTGEKK
ncbi:MAG: extracellular solute-binding protein [Phycisphaeraceae bacterium]